MDFSIWFIVAGLLLTVMALAGSILKRLPLSASLLYLGTGVLVGPVGIGLLYFDPIESATALERLTEIAVSQKWILPRRSSYICPVIFGSQ